MARVKDAFFKAFKTVKHEITRLDRTCNNCRREIFGGDTFGERLFCRDCYNHLPFNNGYICAHCGRSTLEPVKFCDDCVTGYESVFEAARSPFYYAPPVDKFIRNLKYDHQAFYAEVFSGFMAKTLLEEFPTAEVITFSPMLIREKRKRGYNHAELLARRLAEKVGLSVSEVLAKSYKTENQVRLGRDKRLENLKGSIILFDDDFVRGKEVVFVDDVMTTGATAETCAEAMLKAGAKCVYVLTVSSVTDLQIARALGQEISSTRIKKIKRAARRNRKNSQPQK